MSNHSVLDTLKKVHRRLNGSTLEFDLTSYQKTITEIHQHQSRLKEKTDAQLQKISLALRRRVNSGDDLNELLAETFALISESIWRIFKMHPFEGQLIGGIALHQGKLTEMPTGEGKTLMAVFPATLNALLGKGVHVLTFNDYLARRDMNWMDPVYAFLGLSVGVVQEGMSIEERQKAYQSDISYLTAKEAGFDYLRDSLCYDAEKRVHRPFYFALIDEADSILIDEARVPLIIAGLSEDRIADSHQLARIVKQLTEHEDFETDEYGRQIHLTDSGVKNIESRFNGIDLYAGENIDLLTRVNCALHAEVLLNRDVDYIIRNDRVELVDEFTGRVADKRRWPDGLQAAIEAKENLTVQSKGQILNSITLQHFFQYYPKISGMTATAVSAEKEFREFYHLHTVVIPPHRPCIRQDDEDIVYPTKRAKQQALINEISRVHKTGRPILVGTRSVEESILLAEALQLQSVSCEVLNAKNDTYEAQIITQAGKSGAVTVSTNMAGRGVDIKLGGADESEKETVLALGGLYVIGTNRHESARIDLQLRGRAGRQGDPGRSRFFISLEDDLFEKYRLNALFPSNLIPNDEVSELRLSIINREIDRLQRIIEGQHMEIKKTLCQYTHLIEQQSKIVFERRQQVFSDHAVLEFYKCHASDHFNYLLSSIGRDKLIDACRLISLAVIDRNWSQYLVEIADIREGIHLIRLGGKMPLLEFHKQAVQRFEIMQEAADRDTIDAFNTIKVRNGKADLTDADIKAPSATWTYLINDNPFENQLGVQLIGNISLSVGAGIWGPLFMVFKLFKKFRDKKAHHNSK